MEDQFNLIRDKTIDHKSKHFWSKRQKQNIIFS